MEYEISDASMEVRERQEKVMQNHLLKRSAYALAVPTNDFAVRARLQRLGEPVTLFGEREMERRDRLRMIMVNLGTEELFKFQKYPFWTEGSKELLQARHYISRYSLVKAALRLERARRRRDDPDEDFDAELDRSEIDELPLTGCSFSCDGKLLATLSRIGAALRGHTQQVTDVAFSPTATNLLATASIDRTAILWNTEGVCLRKFEGHFDRLARLAFHPSGKYVGTASFDKSWRLWDIETGVELLYQEGHSRGIYGICFHHDGSLAAPRFDSVYGIDFSPNGYHLATGGEDNTCRIWVLRKKKSKYIIPAHSKQISQVKFDHLEGYFLATASLDKTAKIWSARDFMPVKTLSGHDLKVSSLDIAGEGQYIATVSRDKTIKLWESGSGGKENAMDMN
ncbi:hypothetical protein MKW98_016518 [Papaver atlanticum]|uniref:Pre-mRNA processing factor 4 (PRP4)-like domain-containing protein n=1 Tax=Papaver atlanticum TaxID=357466 RepID=A0AAD4T3U8_9MAGN|nr:hypothetical protein MKW98_016518 [Papaver atlanticum]